MIDEMTDFRFFEVMITNYFVTCKHDQKQEVWRCRSNRGIEDERDWDNFVASVKQRWPGRFLQIDHATCTNHTDFSIYLKP